MKGTKMKGVVGKYLVKLNDVDLEFYRLTLTPKRRIPLSVEVKFVQNSLDFETPNYMINHYREEMY